MALIKSVRDEEERKRKQQAQANQTAQTAANKSAQMNSDAAKRNSAGASKAPTQSAADTIKAAKEKAKTGTVTKTPKQYANPAQYVKKSNPVRQTFNYETLGTQERVDQVASWIVDPKEKQGFLDGWTAYTNTKSYKNQQKRKEQLQGLNGLYDANGRPINVNTASYSTVVQGIRSIADATKRKEAAAKLEEMTKTWGSRFYGQTYTPGIVTSYLGNPDFTEEDYKDEVAAFENAFYAQSGYEEQNTQTYIDSIMDIRNSGYSDSVQRQLKQRLDEAWKNTTGKKLPSLNEVSADLVNEYYERAKEEAEKDAKNTQQGDKQGWWGSIVNFFKGEETTEEEAKEDAPKEEGKGIGEAIEDFVTGKTLMDEEWLEENEDKYLGATPDIKQEEGYQGAYASATVNDVPAAVKPGQQKKYIEVKDDADVLRAFLAGRIDEVDPAASRGFLNMVQNPYAKQLLGTVADKDREAAALVGNEGAEMVSFSNLTALGNSFYDAYAMINSEAFPEELRDDGMLVLLDLTRRAALLEEKNELGGDEYLPAMERLLQTDEYAQHQLDSLYGARDAIISNREGILAEQQRSSERAVKEAREAFLKGEASEEQIKLVYGSAPTDWTKKAYKDKTYDSMKKNIHSWDAGYFDEDGGEFYNTALYANLSENVKAHGIDDYKFALSTQMEKVLQADAQLAYSLGMSLEDFYARSGGMTYNSLANRASMNMAEEAKSLTPEDEKAIDAITPKGDGIGWMATGGLAVSQGALSTYEAYADTLYMGVTEGNVIRTGDKMRIQYEKEYGVVEGRQMYRDELQDYIDSGLLDESYAKSLQHALDNVADVYSIGIDPADAEGFIVKSGAWARRNIALQQAYVNENATEAEIEAFNVLAGTVQNTITMGVSWGASALTGAALGGALGTAVSGGKVVSNAITGKGAKLIKKAAGHIGFAVGYDANQLSGNVEKRMDEGYSRDSAVWLGSIDTIGNHFANESTFSNIVGRATGLDPLVSKFMSIAFKNPIGTLKGAAAVRSFVAGAFAGATNITEEIGDTFRESMVQSGIDDWIAPLFRKRDNGEDIQATDYLGALLNAANPANLGKNITDAAKETWASAAEIAIQSSLFAIAGAAGTTYNSYKGYRTAQSMPIHVEGLTEYESVQRAVDIVNGNDNDVQSFLDAFKADLEDDKFIKLFNEAAETTGLAHKTIANLIRARGEEEQVKQIEAKQEQIASHEKKAADSQAAIDTAVQNAAEKQEALNNGVYDQFTADEINAMTESIAKNKNSLDESTREAEQKKNEVKEIQDGLMEEARAKANRQQQAELERLNQQVADMNEQVNLKREADNVTAMEADNFIEQRYAGLPEEQKQRLREIYADTVKGKVNADFKAVDAAVRQFQKKFSNINFKVVDSLAGAEGGYVRDKNTVYIARDMTHSEIVNRVLIHELTHASEGGGKAYEEFRDALLRHKYKGDDAMIEADKASIAKRYNDHYAKNNIIDEKTGKVRIADDDEVMTELVADITGKILSGDEEAVNRLIAEEPTAARRIWDTIKRVLGKLVGVKGQGVDDLRHVEQLFAKALKKSEKANASGSMMQRSVNESLVVSPETNESLVGEVGDTAVQYSLRTWTDEERDEVKSILEQNGFQPRDVERWIADVDGVARIIAADRDRLDFEAADNQVMLKPNQEYVKTLDASTLCAKRLIYQGTFNAIQHAMPNKVITSDGLIKLRNMMAEMGYETPCGICYVESRRRNLGTFASKWLKGYDAKDGYQPKMEDVTTTDGLERMRKEHPEVYKSFTDEMNRKGSNNPKVVQLRTDYQGDIRKLTKSQIEKIVEIGGLRVQSFSDFETPHLLDMMQAVLDMTSKGLTSQAYTKVPNFAAVFGDTGIKINLSLIADGNGLDENGNLVFSSYEGMDFDRAMELRDMYSKNVGTILVGMNDAHIKAAMADPRIDFIIPFHKSGWGKKQLSQLSGMTGYLDYTRDQNERRVIGETKTGKPKTKNVEENFHPVDYWDYSKTGKENAEEYLRMCAEDGRIPKFARFLINNGDGSYSLPEDGSADGYWKLLIDFKMYDNDGVGSPQMPVQPNFNMEEAERVLAEYDGDADTLPVANDVVERYVNEFDGMQRSLPSDDVLNQEIQAYHELQSQPEVEQAQQIPNQDQQQRPQGERQFTVKTLQNSQAVPQWLKNALYNDPQARFYEKDTNNDQIVRSWQRLQSEGYEAMRDRLLSENAQFNNADDVADANMVMAMAEHEGDVQTFLDMALHYAQEGTREAQVLQARKIFSKMTPTGMKVWVSGQAERNLARYIEEHKPVKKRVDRAAKKVEEKIKDLQGGDELLRLQAASEYTITDENNRWGVPINEKQKALIKEYGLEKVARPGINYNRATTKQRMLEAILAEPNPEVKINGISLLHRLELMKANVPVITTADINYMGDRMAEFAHAPVDDQEGRIGDLALARLYEAYGNITPATTAEKAKTWRYTSMLLSVPSSLRNVIGNAAKNTVNATAHSVAHALDWGVSKVTGERAIAGLTFKERADGWHAFKEETINTFRDFYSDKAITSHGEDRHNLNQRGRVYQNGTLEMLRLTEGFLMSVGDRNFWKKAYVNSLAEQQRVAELNGEEFDYEAACEQAEQDANFATFNEDSRVRDLLTRLKNPPEDASEFDKMLAFAVDYLMPFTGVPTNIAKRMIQYSPAGIAVTAVKHGVRKAQGKTFDQRDFVNGMARGLTGTALFAIGMELFKAGLISLGTGDEEDKKIYGAETAQGRQYTPYIRIGDQYIALSTFMPAASAIIMGATAQKVFENDENALNAIKSACFASLDMIFDASYMSSLADIFGGYGTLGENAVDSLVNSTISQNVPAILGQVASAMDPYVSDTKDKDAIMQALKSGLISKIPGLRQQLEAKVDITGEKVRNSKYMVAPIDPFTRSYANDDPVLQELIDFARKSGDTGVIPELFVASNKYEVKVTKTQAKSLKVNKGIGSNGKNEYQALTLDVSDEEKWTLNEKYGKLVFGQLRELLDSRKWKRAEEAERIKLAEDIIKNAKLDILEDFLDERGVK